MHILQKKVIVTGHSNIFKLSIEIIRNDYKDKIS